eukprot:CAMPEP_0176294470 /NCGR_PEP_ID=MMETSP0121_2-20121125/57156_1 /TAXON_ID=160619 /ORGANISM="Kryptoperidinium foliaceum, Strain CCMP 1326" /LENGTH=82 /DNA_ID=CAMNT_0017635495 /DNA_START=83 /DNA_END=329 /DNA_ORIENTATION=-
MGRRSGDSLARHPAALFLWLIVGSDGDAPLQSPRVAAKALQGRASAAPGAGASARNVGRMCARVESSAPYRHGALARSGQDA